jgi:hypothetical protein
MSLQIVIVMRLVWEHYKNAKNVAVLIVATALVMVMEVVVHFVEGMSRSLSDSPNLILNELQIGNIF